MPEALLRLADLHFAHPGRPPLLCGIDLSLQAGERVCIAGDNGSGKSSLLRCIVGLEPCEGLIELAGQACRSKRDFQKLRRRVGLCFQDPRDQLIAPSVLEDVAFGPRNLGLKPDQALERAQQTLERLAIADLAERLCHRLSGGEQRLVTLAGILAMQPDCLLLDEPDTGLDRAARERLLACLHALPQAMLVVSHSEAFTAALAGRRLHLRSGRLLASDPEAG